MSLNRLSLVPPMAVCLAIAACGGSEVATPAPTTGQAGASRLELTDFSVNDVGGVRVSGAATPTSTLIPEATLSPGATPSREATLEPVLIVGELDGFEERSIRYGNVDYTLLNAKVTNQDLRSYAEGGNPVIDEGHFSAILDVRATNTLGSTPAGADAEDFTLEFDGERAPLESSFLSDVTGRIVANASETSFLAFAVDEGTELASAVLVIGAPPDRPAVLNLTGPVPESSYPLAFELGGSALGVGPTNGGTIEFTALEATLFQDLPHEQVTSPTGDRADEGELFLQLHIRAEKLDGRGRDLLSNAFRLLVDDVPLAPFDVADAARGSAPTPAVDPGTAVEAWVLFMLPVDAGTVALEVGAFDQAPGAITIDLPSIPDA